MTFKERINNEKDNLSKIVLYNDRGLFFNLVERSAYAFCTRIKPFKVHVKTLKDLKDPFVYIGVPVEKKDEYLQGLVVTTDDSGNVTALLKEPINENAFQAWKKHIIEQKGIENTAKIQQNSLSAESVPVEAHEIRNDCMIQVIRQFLQEIKTLNIASMTPMEAMIYLNNIQQRFKDVDI